MTANLQRLLFIGLGITLAATFISVLMHAPMVVVAVGSCLSLIVFLFLVKKYFNTQFLLLRQSDELLFKTTSRSKWSFNNVNEIKSNQDELRSKLETAANQILNLVHPDVKLKNSLNANDPIAKALTNIQLELKKIKEDENRRAWVSNGLASFSEVLRKKADLPVYTNNVITSLVKYLDANQGGLFIDQQEENGAHYLELAACYAYGRRKYDDCKVEPGQGLLGQCMLEKDFIFITDVPNNYVRITSGLGEATPRNIIVAPLIFNEVFCGAIELASFKILQDHQIEFLRKICEDIAAEIGSLKTNEKTKQLLAESNLLAQELQSREEEMRQNMEELAATQEEMARKQLELSGIMNAIDSTLATVEFGINGKIIKHNSVFEQFVGLQSNEIIGREIDLVIGHETDATWGMIRSGSIASGDFRTKGKGGADVWLSVTFTPVNDNQGNMQKLLCMVQNITERKVKEKEFERLSLVANNTDNSVIITDKNGIIEYVNQGFTKMTGYHADDVIGKKPGKILQGALTDKNTIQKLRDHIRDGIPVYEEILNYDKEGKSYWVSLAINPVKNERGEIDKFISIQANITETKSRALDFDQKMQALGRSNAIIELNTDGNIIEANANYLSLLSYTREEVIGKPYSLLTQKANTFSKVMSTIKENGLQSGTFSRFDKNGNIHCMKLMDYPVLNLNGELEKIIEFGVDVSNERRLEKEAERRQAELNSYLSGVNNTIASAEFHLDGTFLSANEIFLKVLGLTKEELTRKDIQSLMGDDASVVMMWENLRLGRFFSGEFRIHTDEGKEFWLNGTFNPIIIDGAEPEKIIMLAQFTTQEKEKLNDLHAMVNAFKSTLPVLEFNPDFSCKTANEKAMKMFGLSRLNLKTKSIIDFIAPNYHAAWSKRKIEILKDDFSTTSLPFVVGGTQSSYEVTISIVKNLNGSIAKIIVLLVKEISSSVPALASV